MIYRQNLFNPLKLKQLLNNVSLLQKEGGWGKWTHHLCNTKIDWLVLVRGKIIVYSGNHVKAIRSVCRQNCSY